MSSPGGNTSCQFEEKQQATNEAWRGGTIKAEWKKE